MTEYLERRIDYTEPRVASALDELSLWAARFGRVLLDELELRRGIRALDLGCGTGFPLFELAHAHGASCRFVGLDPWAAGLARAAHKRDVYAVDYIALARGDGAAMPFADGSFDLVVSNLGVNNFGDPPAVLAEAARVSRPGARLALTTNPTGHMREFYAVFREVVGDWGNSDYLARLDVNEARRGSVQSLRSLVEEAGFRVRRVVEDSFRMRYLDGSALLRHPFTIIGFLGGWRAVVDPADEPAVFAGLERRLNALAGREGGLALTVPMLYLEAERA